MDTKQRKGNIFHLVLWFIAGILFLTLGFFLVGIAAGIMVEAFLYGYNLVSLWLH